MSLRYRGSLLSATAPTASIGSAASIWALQEQYQAQAASSWPPSGVGSDDYFKYVSLLLPGNGTNGAQNNTFLDSSSNNFTVTRNGNTTQGTFSPFSQPDGYWSNYFDGTGDFITAPNNNAFDMGSGDFTIDFWFYATTAKNTSFFTKRASGSYAPIMAQLTSSSTLILYCSTSGSSWAVNSTTAATSLNAWHHCAVVRNGTSLVLYLDGVSAASGTVTGALMTNSDSFVIGADDTSGSSGYQGYISNFRVVKGTAVYTSAFTPPTASLTAVSGTSLLTCQSNRFKDNSTNAFAITRNGDAAVTSFSPYPIKLPYSAATNGGSVYFDGSGDYLSVPWNSGAFDFGTGAFTMEVWVYIPTMGDVAFWSTYDYTGGPGEFGAVFAINSNGSIVFYQFLGGSSSQNLITSSGLIRGGEWNHVAVVRESSSVLKIYLNGALAGTNSSFTASVNYTSTQFMMANNDGVYSTACYISNFRIVKGTAVYTGNFTVPTSPLTSISGTSLLYNFTNAGIYDVSAKNNLETVGNAQISTSASKFGSSSMYFDGSGDYLISRYNKLFGLLDDQSDFTIEAWFYRTVGSVAQFAISTFEFSGVYTGWALVFDGTNYAQFFCYDSGNNPQSLTGTSAVSLNTWTHVAVSRYGGVTKLFVNGVNQATRSTAFANTITESPLIIGLRPGALDYPYTGYMQDVRITKGIARYTADFTAPAVPFAVF